MTYIGVAREALEGIDRSHPHVESGGFVPRTAVECRDVFLGVPGIGQSLESEHDAVVVLLVSRLAVIFEHLGEDTNNVL